MHPFMFSTHHFSIALRLEALSKGFRYCTAELEPQPRKSAIIISSRDLKIDCVYWTSAKRLTQHFLLTGKVKPVLFLFMALVKTMPNRT